MPECTQTGNPALTARNRMLHRRRHRQPRLAALMAGAEAAA